MAEVKPNRSRTTVSNLTKWLTGLYLSALAVGGVLLLWLLFLVTSRLAIGFEAASRLPTLPFWPWLPISVATMFAAKFCVRWSIRRDGGQRTD